MMMGGLQRNEMEKYQGCPVFFSSFFFVVSVTQTERKCRKNFLCVICAAKANYKQKNKTKGGSLSNQFSVMYEWVL